MTRDDIEITIPNSVIATSKIVNESGGPGEAERVGLLFQYHMIQIWKKQKTL